MRRTPTYRVVSNPAGMELEAAGGITVLFAGESQTSPEHRVGPKVVDYYLLHHVISGRGTFVSGDLRAELREGHSFLIPPKQLVSYASDPSDPWKYRWAAFDGDLAPHLAETAGFGPEGGFVDTGESRLPAEMCKNIFEAFRSRSRSASLEASGYLYLLLAALQDASSEAQRAALRPDSHSDELVRRMIGYLSTQYAEPVTIEAMAEAIGYNRAYLSRLFKRRTGMTPIAFLTQARIDRGRRLLRERPELTIEQIASSVGIQDALYFSKLFRRRYGESPTEYRHSAGR
ncbi:AraC family transcriptional regulator [Cohnella lubricantis]|uniref:AraC family transcriptional regulator n=1 Tax=Cohnella lubricantis TaxID=2163172 RepID=A0A841TDA3_9BACL|nr:AraC family transcriptional regulator [Cohnella lubricantis]MBB6677979.1 AraC family transcriptional regulator [Cohnella lubricantis]MBP2119953.1 AraC-like DNA-binding protein [Cohnella lubricantis]